MKTNEEFTACVFKKAEERLLEEKRLRQRKRKRIRMITTVAATFIIGVGIIGTYNSSDFKKEQSDKTSTLESQMSYMDENTAPKETALGQPVPEEDTEVRVEVFEKNAMVKKEKIEDTKIFYSWFNHVEENRIFYKEEDLRKSEDFEGDYLRIVQKNGEQSQEKDEENANVLYVIGRYEDIVKGENHD